VDEQTYLEERAAELVERDAAQQGLTRRRALQLAATAVPALSAAALFPPRARAATTSPPPILKPLPPEWFVNFGTNAEMRWDAVDFGYTTPIERFFVRNHTATPLIDARSWRLAIYGTGLRGAPTADRPRTLDLRDLLRLPSRTITAAIECAGNGRSYFGSQQGTPVSGTQWHLGAIGVARWTGVPLSIVLERAGLTRRAVDVMPIGLDSPVVVNGTDAGHVRRPLPVAKALDDVLLAYEMNGRPLPPDHGGPVRLVVPGWVGVANIKWVGAIEVADQPLFSTWNTTQYRMIGPDYPPDSPPLTTQVVKSAFELAQGATIPSGQPVELSGRSWSGTGAIERVEVSTDGGSSWRRAHLHGPNRPRAWTRWRLPWHPETPGPTTLLARATDTRGRTQPDTVPFNTGGYLFGAVVRHPVTVS
jgi:DMSO/TMAO reductase YedYZ molybdopterin-dependent catalytic subunit